MRLVTPTALVGAVVIAGLIVPTPAQAFTAVPAKDRAATAIYYGDPGTGRASRSSSPYIAAVARILTRQRSYLATACTKPHAAIVFDVDDTVLSTYDMYVGAMHYRLDRPVKADWVREEKFSAVPGMVQFAKLAKKSGCRLDLVSGRPSVQTSATLANLAKVGYPAFSRVTFPTAGSGLTTQQFKTRARAALVRAGVVIVANIGDQTSDLSGGHAARDIRLPNRMYTIP
jgi:HAD superfamily, subfamily IIIB (Acid phosphatase)